MHYYRHYPSAREIDFLARESIDPSMACNSHGIPVSVREVARDIRDVLTTKGIKEEPTLRLPEDSIRKIRRTYAKLFNGELEGAYLTGTRGALAGVLAEHIAVRHTKNIIEEKHLPLDIINVTELWNKLPGHGFMRGCLPDEVTFLEPIGRQPFMEVDLLLQTYAKDGYIAFDFASHLDGKKMNYADRSERVDYVSREILGSPLVLIDASLGENRASLMKKTENLYRMNVPCDLDFQEILNRFLRKGK